jgi:hypothetical protein
VNAICPYPTLVPDDPFAPTIGLSPALPGGSCALACPPHAYSAEVFNNLRGIMGIAVSIFIHL